MEKPIVLHLSLLSMVKVSKLFRISSEIFAYMNRCVTGIVRLIVMWCANSYMGALQLIGALDLECHLISFYVA